MGHLTDCSLQDCCSVQVYVRRCEMHRIFSNRVISLRVFINEHLRSRAHRFPGTEPAQPEELTYICFLDNAANSGFTSASLTIALQQLPLPASPVLDPRVKAALPRWRLSKSSPLAGSQVLPLAQQVNQSQWPLLLFSALPSSRCFRLPSLHRNQVSAGFEHYPLAPFSPRSPRKLAGIANFGRSCAIQDPAARGASTKKRDRLGITI